MCVCVNICKEYVSLSVVVFCSCSYCASDAFVSQADMDDAAPAKPEPMEEVVGAMAAPSSSSSSSSAAANAPKKELQPIKTTLTPEVEVYLHLLALLYVMDHGSADEVRCDACPSWAFVCVTMGGRWVFCGGMNIQPFPYCRSTAVPLPHVSRHWHVRRL